MPIKPVRTLVAVAAISTASSRSARRLMLAVILALLAVSLPVQIATGATPRITFIVSGRVQAGGSVSIQYSVGSIGATKVQVQRQFGTSKTFKTIKSLPVVHHLTASSVAAPPNMGRYVYRMRALNAHGSVIASKSRTVTVYKTVQLGTLLGGGTNTTTVGTREFRYAWAKSLQTPDWCCGPQSGVVIKRANTSCQWIDLKTGNNQLDGSPQYSLVLTQENADAISRPFPNSTIADTGHLTLAGGGFQVVAKASGGSGYSRVFVNGTANCWTTSGTAP